ncbi:hypothetical protein J6500_13690 [Bradyrhizobium sp. WSM 1704]|nr:hypothetical protein [Bradyrhizobium semiaridum]
MARDLELIVLQEIRAFPGAEYVVAVQIVGAGDEWSFVISVKDGADFARIQYAARTTEQRRKHRYSLRHDGAD